MSVYDEMYDCVETAWSTDACEYNVYSEMVNLIAEAETENAKLHDAVSYLYRFARTLGVDEGDMRGFGIEVE